MFWPYSNRFSFCALGGLEQRVAEPRCRVEAIHGPVHGEVDADETVVIGLRALQA